MAKPEEAFDTRVNFEEGKDEVRVTLDPEGSQHDDCNHTEKAEAEKGADNRGDEEAPADDVDACGRAHNKCLLYINISQTLVHSFIRRNMPLAKKILIGILVLLYLVYFIYVVWYDARGGIVVIVLTTLLGFIAVCRLITYFFGAKLNKLILVPLQSIFKHRSWRHIQRSIYVMILVGVLIFVIIDVARDSKRLTSFLGMILFIVLGFVTSKNPAKVQWRPVVWGMGLQFVLGIIILRWPVGYHIFRFLGDQVKVFLEYADEGSKFVFGDPEYKDHEMAFKVFPIVIFFSAVVQVCYYWGLMQYIVCKIAWLMQLTMGTTAIESLNAATNIFIGMAESCVILRPFVPKLTKSELHAVMTGGFATVAGSYIALLVEVGASPEHLLSAAIMSAPAALAMAKLSYPETEVSQTKTESDVYMEKTPARNVVEAASTGAIDAIKVIASVGANLIAILGLIAFLNASLSYFGARAGYPNLSFQLICSYVFWPLAIVMGVDVEDAGKVATLLGTKIFVDEFISFRDLGVMVRAGTIGDRSAVIATYACCGFGSIAAVGIYIGALVSVAPSKRGDISEVAFRAVVNGNVAGFLTACLAGLLYTGVSLFDMHPSNSTTDNPAVTAMTAIL